MDAYTLDMQDAYETPEREGCLRKRILTHSQKLQAIDRAVHTAKPVAERLDDILEILTGSREISK